MIMLTFDYRLEWPDSVKHYLEGIQIPGHSSSYFFVFDCLFFGSILLFAFNSCYSFILGVGHAFSDVNPITSCVNLGDSSTMVDSQVHHSHIQRYLLQECSCYDLDQPIYDIPHYHHCWVQCR